MKRFLAAAVLAAFYLAPSAHAQSDADVHVFFTRGSTHLTPEGEDLLQRVRNSHAARLVIKGYATPEDVYDEETHQIGDIKAFSLVRAQAMADYLHANGMADVPMAVEGDGMNDLMAPLDPATEYSAADATLDRRVDIYIMAN